MSSSSPAQLSEEERTKLGVTDTFAQVRRRMPRWHARTATRALRRARPMPTGLPSLPSLAAARRLCGELAAPDLAAGGGADAGVPWGHRRGAAAGAHVRRRERCTRRRPPQVPRSLARLARGDAGPRPHGAVRPRGGCGALLVRQPVRVARDDRETADRATAGPRRAPGRPIGLPPIVHAPANRAHAASVGDARRGRRR